MQSGYIKSLQMQKEKGEPYKKKEILELIKGKGISGDIHFLSENKQVAIITTKAKICMTKDKTVGLCYSKFQANIEIDGIDFNRLKRGDLLKFKEAVLEIISFKRCFQECRLIQEGLPCELSKGIIFAYVSESGIICIEEKVNSNFIHHVENS